MSKLNDLKKTIFSGAFLQKIGGFFARSFRLCVFALFFGLSGYCVYLWYFYVYNYQWSEERKTEYLKTKDNEVTFDRQKFQEIVEREARKSLEYGKAVVVERDIFGIK